MLQTFTSPHAKDKKTSDALLRLDSKRKKIEAEVMLDGNDPTDVICADLSQQFTQAGSTAEKLRIQSQRSFWRKVMSRVPAGPDINERKRKVLSGLIEQIDVGYETSSDVRRQFDQISTYAYMKSLPFSVAAYGKVSSTEWNVKFSLLSTSDTSTWKALDYDAQDFEKWWRTRQGLAKLKRQVGQEWKDMQALCSAITQILEHLDFLGCLGTSADIDLTNLGDFIQLITKRLSQAMNFPEHYSSTSEFFGLVAPFIYVSHKCITALRISCSKTNNQTVARVDLQSSENTGTGQSNDLQATIDFFMRQIVCLDNLARLLVRESENLPRAKKQPDLTTIVEESSSHSSNIETDESRRAIMSLDSLPKYDLKALERLGLRHITLTPVAAGQIGFGSSAVVLKRYEPNGLIAYAVKQPSQEAQLNHNAIWNRVGREAEIWSTLMHDNILPLRGFYMLPENIPALVLDLCNFNLKQYVEIFRGVSERKKLELLLGVAKAVRYLHSKKIAHGDLRASNVLVKQNKTNTGHSAFLADFGTAYYVDRRSDPHLVDLIFETTHGQVGNPHWLSPELLNKAGSHRNGTDKACISLEGDIYSFGCMFLEVVYSRDPYASFTNDVEKRKMKLDGHPPATLDETSERHYRFLCTLWNSEPDSRPSADCVVSYLASCL